MKIQGKMFIWLRRLRPRHGDRLRRVVEGAGGTTALFLAFGLCIMIGYYLAFTARRVDAGAQDNKEADVADDAGEVGLLQPAQLAAALARPSVARSPSWASSSAGGCCTSRPRCS